MPRYTVSLKKLKKPEGFDGPVLLQLPDGRTFNADQDEFSFDIDLPEGRQLVEMQVLDARDNKTQGKFTLVLGDGSASKYKPQFSTPFDRSFEINFKAGATKQSKSEVKSRAGTTLPERSSKKPKHGEIPQTGSSELVPLRAQPVSPYANLIQGCTVQSASAAPLLLPEPLPIARNLRLYTDSETGTQWVIFVMHHDMRGDMYGVGALMVLYPNVCVELLYEPGQESRLNRHLRFFAQILAGYLDDPVHKLEDRVGQRPVPEEIISEYEEDEEARSKSKDVVQYFYRTHVENPKSVWRISIYRNAEQGSSNPEIHLWRQILEGNNNLGVSTCLIGQAFEQNAAETRQTILQSFALAIAPDVMAQVDAFVDQFVQVAALQEVRQAVILWSRQSDNGPEWNMSSEVFRQLQELIADLSACTHTPITVIAGGDPLEGCEDLQPSPKNLIEFWKRTSFPAIAQDDMRVQFYFWHCLMQKTNCSFVMLGMRSGFLEPLAMLLDKDRMMVWYLEKFEFTRGRTLRMCQFSGRLPYEGLFISEYPGPPRNGTLNEQDRMRIFSALHQTISHRSATREHIREFHPIGRVTRELIIDGRTFHVVDAKDVQGGDVYVAFLLLCGGQVENISSSKALRDEIQTFRIRFSQQKFGPAQAVQVLSSRFSKAIVVYGYEYEAIKEKSRLEGPGPAIYLLQVSENPAKFLPMFPARTDLPSPVTESHEFAPEVAVRVPSPLPPPIPPDESHAPPTMEAEILYCEVCGNADTGNGAGRVRTYTCTADKPGCKKKILVCGTYASGCMQRYFAVRDSCGDGNNRCLACLLQDDPDAMAKLRS